MLSRRCRVRFVTGGDAAAAETPHGAEASAAELKERSAGNRKLQLEFFAAKLASPRLGASPVWRLCRVRRQQGSVLSVRSPSSSWRRLKAPSAQRLAYNGLKGFWAIRTFLLEPNRMRKNER